MKIICTQFGIVSMTMSGYGIKDIAQAGFSSVSLDMFALYPAGEFDNFRIQGKIKNKKNNEIWDRPELMYEKIRQIIDKYKAGNLKVDLVRAPHFSYTVDMFRFLEQECADSRVLLSLLVKINKECIRLCGELNCPYIIIPPVCCHADDETGQRINESYYHILADAARKSNVMVLLENVYMNFNGHLIRGAFSDSKGVAEFIDMLNAEAGAGKEIFGFCMDVGVCNLCGQNMYEYIRNLGHRLKAVIMRDCNGNQESAMMPFSSVYRGRSQTDWLNLIRGLRETEFDGELIMDIRDTIAAFSRILHPEVLRLSKKTADFLKWQIEIEKTLKKYPSRVLFGAGNMCRNYMKCYGEKYPPMFTCDNDKSVWDTKFCGLTVKEPCYLKELPEDCAIFICNIYYQDIREQILEMGVKNPIEYFNDEYMPSFYIERLEMKRKYLC